MAGTQAQLYVFAYDISDDRRRARLAALLEDHAVRVQGSVFEAVLTPAEAAKIGKAIKREILPGDRLRIYPIALAAIERIDRYGGAPLPEASGAWIL